MAGIACQIDTFLMMGVFLLVCWLPIRQSFSSLPGEQSPQICILKLASSVPRTSFSPTNEGFSVELKYLLHLYMESDPEFHIFALGIIWPAVSRVTGFHIRCSFEKVYGDTVFL